jgi:hypothetical protein
MLSSAGRGRTLTIAAHKTDPARLTFKYHQKGQVYYARQQDHAATYERSEYRFMQSCVYVRLIRLCF